MKRNIVNSETPTDVLLGPRFNIGNLITGVVEGRCRNTNN